MLIYSSGPCHELCHDRVLFCRHRGVIQHWNTTASPWARLPLLCRKLPSTSRQAFASSGKQKGSGVNCLETTQPQQHLPAPRGNESWPLMLRSPVIRGYGPASELGSDYTVTRISTLPWFWRKETPHPRVSDKRCAVSVSRRWRYQEIPEVQGMPCGLPNSWAAFTVQLFLCHFKKKVRFGYHLLHGNKPLKCTAGQGEAQPLAGSRIRLSDNFSNPSLQLMTLPKPNLGFQN